MDRELDMQAVCLAVALAFFREGSRIDIKRAMMETTTRSSTSVNPAR
jgi:hypothetical protein